jgi:signal peptidase II
LLTATVGCLVVASDQWTKSRIEAGLGPGFPSSRIDLIGDWFALEYAENRGVAFGFLGTNPDLVTGVSLVILTLVLVYALRRDGASSWFWLGMGLLIGGAVGNLIDRLRLGYVIDFVAIGPWPNFNVADAAIAIGVALLAIDALGPPGSTELGERERRRRPAMSDADSSHD